MRLAIVPALVLALVALAPACEEAVGEDERLSQTEYRDRADAICREYAGRLEALPAPAAVADLPDVVEEAVPIAREGVGRLRELRPPPEIEADVERWLARNDENVRLLERLGEAAGEGDETRVQRIASEAAENERRADELARELGLRDCAEEEGVSPEG